MSRIPKSLLGANGHLQRGVFCFYEGASGPTDLVIRLCSNSFWTHLGVSNGEGQVYNASFYGGVSLANEIQACDSAYAMYPGNVDTLCKVLESKLGLGYDALGCVCPIMYNLGLASLIPDAHCFNAKSFFCSSYLAYAMRLDNGLPNCYQPAIYKPVRAVIPQDIYNALSTRIVVG
jgi:hypothetical protein